MIQVTESELKQVEYLIQQSIQGNHILFDINTIRKAFESNKYTSSEEDFEMTAQDAEGHLEKLISLPTLIQKKFYLENLEKDTFHELIRVYFNIVESKIFETEKKVVH